MSGSSYCYIDLIRMLAVINDIETACFLVMKMVEDYPIESKNSIPHIIIESVKDTHPLFYYQLFEYLSILSTE